ncbi:AT-hook motif nuclear-localized protein 2 [Sesamum angolense]|uniref:AT-hook motif nuclear-localized protein n=1 Tax=Sesamum angolense TaxID=2727404 RepID=A0AAE1T6H2_9LAMI|nr:AT-hook motif nuclear-localized protein 2 [Sesamum angolense]
MLRLPPRNGSMFPGGSFFNPGARMMPHLINVAAGEDVRRRILSFSQGRHAVVVLSGIGIISAVTVRSNSGGNATYEGRHDILNLSGYYANNDLTAAQAPIGRLSVILAGPEGTAIGGTVEGAMIAATAVQVVVVALFPRSPKTKNNAGQRPEPSADRENVGNLVAPANA